MFVGSVVIEKVKCVKQVIYNWLIESVYLRLGLQVHGYVYVHTGVQIGLLYAFEMIPWGITQFLDLPGLDFMGNVKFGAWH